jgi:hypothetical protein
LEPSSIFGKTITISPNYDNIGSEVGWIGVAVENCNLVAPMTQLVDQGDADEAVSADHKNSHTRSHLTGFRFYPCATSVPDMRDARAKTAFANVID